MVRLNQASILVTGGAGFIGSNLAIRLVEEGAKVKVLDGFIPSSGANSFNLQPIHEKISLEKWDMRNADKLPKLVADCDIIFNLVGQVSHQDSIVNPKMDMEINIQAILNLLEACRYHNPNATIIYTSTRQIYGTPNYLPVDEEHPINPVDFNGVSNLAGEYYHTLYSRLFGIKTVSLRLTNTFGPRLLIKHSRQGFMGWFINRALTGNTIQLFGGGNQLRDLNYVEDVIDALLLAAQTEACFGKVFNLSGEKSSLRAIASQLIHLTGRGAIDTIPFPENLKKIDIGDYYGVSKKFSELTGWLPKTNLDDGLKQTVHFFEEFKNQYLEATP